jgi:S1-C subfamily serine protease
MVVIGVLSLLILAPVSIKGSTAPTPNPKQTALTNTDENTAEIKVIASTVKSVVLISTFDDDGNSLKEGSGFIVSTDGRILTNYHVIAGAHSALVKLSDGSYFPVDGVVAFSETTDLALLKVSGTNLPTLKIENKDNVIVGERVIAVGSPLGLQNTVSDGIVSAVRDEDGTKWIQTTAPISPGNSGGPLLNLDGKVVGVITARIVGGENLNLAIPIVISRPLLSATAKPIALDVASDTSTKPAPAATDQATAETQTWTSLTSGHQYNVRIEDQYIYAEWIDIPQELRDAGVFATMDLQKVGNLWSGKSRGLAPVTLDNGTTIYCRYEVDAQITSVSANRIEGSSQVPTRVDGNCALKSVKSQSFVWIPKE